MVGRKVRKQNPNLVKIQVSIPRAWLSEIERLVQEGRYAHVSEFIRAAVYELINFERRVRNNVQRWLERLRLELLDGCHEPVEIWHEPIIDKLISAGAIVFICAYCGFPVATLSVTKFVRYYERTHIPYPPWSKLFTPIRCPNCGRVVLFRRADNAHYTWITKRKVY